MVINVNLKNTEILIFSVAVGYATILNFMRSSFYPTTLLITVSFGIGIAMVFSSLYVFTSEPGENKVMVIRVNEQYAASRRPVAIT